MSLNLLTGWLEKQSRYLRIWKRRWVVLQSDTLLTFETDSKVASADEALDLHGATVQHYKDTNSKHPFMFLVSNASNGFLFSAPSHEDYDVWTSTLEKVIAQTQGQASATQTPEPVSAAPPVAINIDDFEVDPASSRSPGALQQHDDDGDLGSAARAQARPPDQDETTFFNNPLSSSRSGRTPSADGGSARPTPSPSPPPPSPAPAQPSSVLVQRVAYSASSSASTPSARPASRAPERASHPPSSATHKPPKRAAHAASPGAGGQGTSVTAFGRAFCGSLMNARSLRRNRLPPFVAITLVLLVNVVVAVPLFMLFLPTDNE